MAILGDRDAEALRQLPGAYSLALTPRHLGAHGRGHLYRASAKLGIATRDELAAPSEVTNPIE